MGRTLRTSLVALLLPVLLLSAGCGGGTAKPTGKALRGVAVKEVRPAGDFTLTDHNGAPLRMQDLRGKAVALFFGYTHCPDICPLTMSVMSQAATTLGKDAEQVRFLFVTVDPERDSVGVLGTYVARWDQVTVTGLTGSQDELDPVYAHYSVAIEKVPKQNGGYAVNHSAQTWLIDQKGIIRAYLPMGASGEDLANDIRYLLKNP